MHSACSASNARGDIPSDFSRIWNITDGGSGMHEVVTSGSHTHTHTHTAGPVITVQTPPQVVRTRRDAV